MQYVRTLGRLLWILTEKQPMRGDAPKINQVATEEKQKEHDPQIMLGENIG